MYVWVCVFVVVVGRVVVVVVEGRGQCMWMCPHVWTVASHCVACMKYGLQQPAGAPVKAVPAAPAGTAGTPAHTHLLMGDVKWVYMSTASA